MARESRREAPAVEKELLARARRFSFVQTLRLLRLLVRRQQGPGLDDKMLDRLIRVRPQLSLDFPGTDVSRVEADPGDGVRFRVTANFFGLYGSSSPLPTFYTEDLLQERNDERCITRDFLDIINIPLYQLLFRAWGKYRLLYQIDEEKDQRSLERLYCLLGLGNGFFRRRLADPFRMLRYLGLATQLPRSCQGLQAMLCDTLCLEQVEVIGCIEQMAPVPPGKRLVLGRPENVLGSNTVLGELVPDRMGRFRVRVEPAGAGLLHELLPDGEAFGKIEEIIGFYLDQPLDWDVEVVLEADQVQSPTLGQERWGRLGWNTWLVAGKSGNRQFSVRLTTVTANTEDRNGVSE